ERDPRRRRRLADLLQEVEVEVASSVRLAPLLEVHRAPKRSVADELRLLDLADRDARVRPEVEWIDRLPPIELADGPPGLLRSQQRIEPEQTHEPGDSR